LNDFYCLDCKDTDFCWTVEKSGVVFFVMTDAFWENDSTLNFIAPFYYSRGSAEYQRRNGELNNLCHFNKKNEAVLKVFRNANFAN